MRAALGLVLAAGAASACATSPSSPEICAGAIGYVWGETVQWDDASGPAAREHAIFLADPARNRLILIGGTGYEPYLQPLNDAWAFDLSDRAWRELTLEGALPEGGSQRAGALDEQGVTYVYGGYDPTQRPLAGLHRLAVGEDAIVVSQIEAEGGPPASMLHAFVRTGGDAFLLFGGVTFEDTFGLSNTAWTLRVDEAAGTARWAQLSSAEAPAARYGFAYGFRPASNDLVVWGGADLGFPQTELTDAWSVSALAENRPLAPTGQPPSGRRNPLFAYNAVSEHLVVFGGAADPATAAEGAYALDLSSDAADWRALPEGPGSRASGMAVATPGRASTWLGFGNTQDERFQDLTELAWCGER